MKTINEWLMLMTKDEQMELTTRLGLAPLRRNARKADWAAHIEQGMMAEPERVRMLMRVEWIKALQKQLSKGHEVALQSMEENEDLLDAIVELDACGLAWRDAKAWHIQPCVDGMMVMDAQEEKERYAYDVMADLIEGWLMHVGMMPLYELVDWMLADMGLEGEPAKEMQQTILQVLIARRSSGCVYEDHENHLWAVHQDVDDPDALLDRLLEPHIAALDYPAFKAEELICSAAHSHLPGKMSVYEPLLDWMDAHDANDDQIEDALQDLVYLTQNNERNEGLEYVMRSVPPTSLKDAQRCCEAARKVLNRMPLWANKGHSAEELVQASQTQRLTAAMPGRNDPCPCGSGKKYKQCCGNRIN